MSIKEFDFEKHIESLYALYIKKFYNLLKNDRDTIKFVKRFFNPNNPSILKKIKSLDDIADTINRALIDNSIKAKAYDGNYINKVSNVECKIADTLQRYWIETWINRNKESQQTVYKNFVAALYNRRHQEVESYYRTVLGYDDSPVDFFLDSFDWSQSSKSQEYWDALNKMYQAVCPIHTLDNFGKEYKYAKKFF